MYKVVEITEGKFFGGDHHNDNVGHHLILLVDHQGDEHVAVPEYFTSWEEAVKVIGVLNGG